MEDGRKHFGAWAVFKLFTVCAAGLLLLFSVLWFLGIPVVKTFKYLDIHSGREKVETIYFVIPGKSQIIDTPFAQSAARQGLITKPPEWHTFQIKTWPHDRMGRVFGVGFAISQLRQLERAFQANNTPGPMRDAMVKAVFPPLSTFTSFQVDYDGDMRPIGVDGKPVVVP